MSAALIHRNEIDGLRAIAVLPVILFHAGFSAFSGGFVGVDVFFVISGYLITTIILREQQTGRFTIAGFYERRARRILPALFLVLGGCTVFAWLWMMPAQVESFAQGLVAVSMFASNILFWRTSGYFDTASEENPLLHTWSLGIEEQYYLVFPLLIILLWRFGRRRLFWLLVLGAIVSLVLCEWGWRYKPSAAFYLLPTRAWELLIGGLLAFAGFSNPLHGRVRPITADIIAACGLLLIVFAIFFFDEKTPFPSVYTLIPAAGAVAVLAFAHTGGWVGRLLSLKWMVGIGLISYSLYLWHQPLFAFARIYSFDPVTPMMYGILSITAVALAYLSYRVVEKPFRDRNKISRRQIFVFSFLGTVFFIVVGIVGYRQDGFPGRLPEQQRMLADTVGYSPKREACHTGGEEYLQPNNACVYFKGPVTWAVFGNSYGVEIAYALAAGLQNKDRGVLHLSFSDCPPLMAPEPKRASCYRWTQAALDRVVSDANIKNVLLAYSQGSYKDESTRESHWQSFKEILARLQAAQKRIYVLFPVPQLEQDISKYISHQLTRGPTFEQFRSVNEFILGRLNQIDWGPDLIRIEPSSVLCDREQCYAVIDNTAMYFDSHHLSVDGARRVLARTLREAQ